MHRETRILIKATAGRDAYWGDLPVGSMFEFAGLPGAAVDGWLDADGGTERAKDWPELARFCRRYTPWWMRLVRRFRKPDMRGHVMVTDVQVPTHG